MWAMVGLDMDDEITSWIERLKQGDSHSTQKIWKAFFEQLVQRVRFRLADKGVRRRAFDEEDIALSAFDSFFQGVNEQRFPKLDDRHDLWKILIVIAARKGNDRRKAANAIKRGGGDERGESICGSSDEDGGGGLDKFLGKEPTPELAAEFAELFEKLMSQLPDESLQLIAQLKFEGFTNAEIAAKIVKSERTVERKLERIREIWGKEVLQ